MSIIEYDFFDQQTKIIRLQGGMSPSPLTTLGPFNFAFDTAGLTTGVTLWTPSVGTLIYDILFSVTTAFDGTTPKADIGTFVGGNAGLFSELGGAGVIDLTSANAAVTDNAGAAVIPLDNSLLVNTIQTPLPSVLTITDSNPLLLVVSQDGTKGGTATGATAGAGAVYILASTPYTG